MIFPSELFSHYIVPKSPLDWLYVNKFISDIARVFVYNDPRVDPSKLNNWPIRKASRNGDLNSVRVLLRIPKVNPAAFHDECIIESARGGYLQIVRLLLQDPRVNHRADFDLPFRLSISMGHLPVVKEFLKYDVRDCGWLCGIKSAALKGFNEIVEMLLSEKKMKYTVEIGYTFSCAIISGNYQIVKLLLSDPRLEFKREHVIEVALNEQWEILKLLLESGKVNPTTNINYLLKIILEKNNLEMIRWITTYPEFKCYFTKS